MKSALFLLLFLSSHAYGHCAPLGNETPSFASQIEDSAEYCSAISKEIQDLSAEQKRREEQELANRQISVGKEPLEREKAEQKARACNRTSWVVGGLILGVTAVLVAGLALLQSIIM